MFDFPFFKSLQFQYIVNGGWCWSAPLLPTTHTKSNSNLKTKQKKWGENNDNGNLSKNKLGRTENNKNLCKCFCEKWKSNNSQQQQQKKKEQKTTKANDEAIKHSVLFSNQKIFDVWLFFISFSLFLSIPRTPFHHALTFSMCVYVCVCVLSRYA